MASASAGLPMGEELYRGLKVGKYEVLTQLSAGGMAELFLAFTKGPGGFRKYVVVKRILPDAKDNDHFVKMFLDEARITAAFNHPNIGQVFDLESDAEGPYLAMEFIAGQNLNQVTSACAKKRAVLPIGFSASVAHDLALALHYAHTFKDPAGKPFPVIHRDVAQKNIMVTYDGVVKLLDFGIAKARGSLGRTTVGTVKGTTGYMSPEQVKGEQLDGRSDVFSLGVVLWEMVTGKRLFAGDTEIDEMKLILSAQVTPPSQVISVVPETLSDIVMRALARERADRFPSAKDLAKAMELACPELLFDVDQRASFMRELFAEKVTATQALLESAGGELEKAAVLDAVKVIREDDGKSFPAPRMSPAAPRLKKRTQPPRNKTQEDEELAALKIKQEAEIARLVGATGLAPTTRPEAPKPEPEKADEKSSGSNVLLLVFAFLAAAGGFFVYKSLLNPDPAIPVAEAPNGGGIPGVDSHPVPGDPTRLQPLPQPGQPPQPPATTDPKKAPPGDTPKPKAEGTARAGHATGTLMLVVFPKAKVFNGKKLIGEATPILQTQLPEGSYVLHLVGDDGKRRPLSVKINAGKTTTFKLNLEDVQ